MRKPLRIFRSFAAAVLLLAFASCAREQRVVIVSTNDIHSAIDNFPRLATLVDSIRLAAGCPVLVVDAGDRWTGNPFVDLAARPLSPIIELMNELGYDIATIGNHEFDWGQALLEERIREMDYPVVCANIEIGPGALLTYIPPYAYIEAGGLRMAFLGLVTNFTPYHRPEGKTENFIGLTFPDPFATAEKYASLRDSCDVFIGLTHIGDLADSVLALRVPDLDLIIGGHSHTLITEPRVYDKTIVTQTGSKLRHAGVTTVTKKRGRLTVENHIVSLDTIRPSERYAEMVARYNDNPELLAPIGRTDAPFNRFGVVNLVTDAVLSKTQADIALYHSGGIRIDALDGVITVADPFRIEPFFSEVYTLRMTAGEIKGLIINKFNDTVNPKESHGPDLFPSGFRYTIITDEAGEAVNVVFTGVEHPSYVVAIPDYIYKNYDFVRTDEAAETGLMVTDAIREYVRKRSPLVPDNTARIRIE